MRRPRACQSCDQGIALRLTHALAAALLAIQYPLGWLMLAGAFFGELALLGDSVRTANVTTTIASTLLILDLADFRSLTANHADLRRAIDEEGQRRMRENLQQYERQHADGASPV